MKQLILSIILITLIFSCTTLQEDMVHQSMGSAQFEELQQWEDELVRLMHPHAEADVLGSLQKIRLGLEEQEEQSLNRQYLANLYALRGWEAWLSGEIRRGKNWLEKAQEQDPREERVILLQAILTPDPQVAAALTEQQDPGYFYRLQLYRAWLLYQLEDYGTAVSLFDQAMNELPQVYREIYSIYRDQAWELKDLNYQGTISLSDAPLTMGEMVELTRHETLLLDEISRQNQLRLRQLYTELQHRGFILAHKEMDQQVDRGDGALFLWMLLIHKENKPEWENMYSQNFTVSPIGDLPLDSSYFDGALGCVEREIMSLPDGEYFYPGLLLSGIEFLEMIENLENY